MSPAAWKFLTENGLYILLLLFLVLRGMNSLAERYMEHRERMAGHCQQCCDTAVERLDEPEELS